MKKSLRISVVALTLVAAAVAVDPQQISDSRVADFVRAGRIRVEASTWRAPFGLEPMLSSDGFGTGATPWRAVQVTAWEALERTPREPAPPTPAPDIILP